jgi:hypothetical protein
MPGGSCVLLILRRERRALSASPRVRLLPVTVPMLPDQICEWAYEHEKKHAGQEFSGIELAQEGESETPDHENEQWVERKSHERLGTFLRIEKIADLH